MRFHLPRPLHGWRALAGEVGVIVLGVLIALGVGQVAEAVHWRDEVAQATAGLRDELGEVAEQAAEQQIAQPCVDRQLALLEERLLAPGAYRPAPLFEEAGLPSYTVRAPSRGWNDGIWQSVIGDNISSHLPPGRRTLLTRVYDNVSEFRVRAQLVDAAIWRLRVLARPVVVDSATRTQIVADLEELRGREALMALMAGQLLGGIQTAELMPTPQQFRDYLSRSGSIRFCRAHGLPLGRARAMG